MCTTTSLSMLLVVTLLGCPSLVSGQPPVPYVVRDAVTSCLNVRPEPHTDAPALACLAPETQVRVLDAVPYWRQIRLADGRVGWAAKKFLAPAAPAPLQPVPVPLPAEAWLAVHFVDVGQGDGIWIQTHDDGIDGNGIFEGRNIIIDGGPDSADHRNALFAYLRNHAHEDALIDTVIVTHPHIDHYAGADTIFRHFEVATYYDPGFPRGGIAYPAFLAAVVLVYREASGKRSGCGVVSCCLRKSRALSAC